MTRSLSAGTGVVRPEARVPVLDGVRGLAIALVMAYHFVYLSGAPDAASAADRALWKITGLGWSGVDLFFVLSGFLITGILYDAKLAAGRYFRTFYGRRALRIFPAYYLFLLLLMVVLPWIDPDAKDAARAVRDQALWYTTYLTNIHVIFDSSLQADFFFAGHLWSLAAEEQFYLVWPAVVLLLPRRALISVCLAALPGALLLRSALEAGGAPSGLAYELMPSRMDALAVGGLVALAARDAGEFAVVTRWLPRLGLAGGAVLVVTYAVRRDLSPPFDAWMLTAGLSAFALAYGGLVVAVLTSGATMLRAAFSGRVLTSLGRYSYALYLIHLPVAAVLSHRFDIVDDLPAVGSSDVIGILAFCAVAAVVSYALAWLSWQVWESQWLKLKTRLPYGTGR